MSQWFRFYTEVLDDPKVQNLPPALFKIWVNTMCIAGMMGGMLPSSRELSFKLRMRLDHTLKALSSLIEVGLIEDNNGVLSIHSWGKRQYKSDVSTERVKRFRNEKRNSKETPPDTDTDTEAEREDRQEYVDRVVREPSAVPDATTPPTVQPADVFSEQPVPQSPPAGWLEDCINVKGMNEPMAKATWERFTEHYRGKSKTHTAWKLAWCKWWSGQFVPTQPPAESVQKEPEEISPETHEKNRRFYLGKGLHHKLYNPDILKLTTDEIANLKPLNWENHHAPR